ncbi:hypothetical protein Prudu_1488S000300 [Prunus dulcis]|uniref:Uncharacterized protein n=1 Tax=Prunus dulcis TaxID=3755 RepID=A0A5H2XRS3_PRUDU|nr:hypothetical protein Prudu_1488S000300 [Prunus dulcis]
MDGWGKELGQLTWNFVSSDLNAKTRVDLEKIRAEKERAKNGHVPSGALDTKLYQDCCCCYGLDEFRGHVLKEDGSRMTPKVWGKGEAFGF